MSMSAGADLDTSTRSMNLKISEPLRLRDEVIAAALRRAAESGGKTGEAAELLQTILLPHLAKERVDLLPPLAVLPALARGQFSPEMAGVLPQIEQLKRDQHTLQVEHATILSAIKLLVAAAREEDKSQHARFAELLLFRAWLDQSLFTPLAIVIGKYVQLRLHASALPAPAPSSLGQRPEIELPEALRLSHSRLSAALAKAMRAGGQTMVAAEVLAQLLESHLHKEDKAIFRILGLLELIAADEKEAVSAADVSEWDELEPSETSLHEEHMALMRATEKLLVNARAEDADEVVDFAERLLLRIQLDEEILYPAALLTRNYLKWQGRTNSPA